MLRTENIQYRIGHKDILKGVSASFLPGDFNMILGPNGSGKSSYLKIFSGEIIPSAGRVFYNNKDLRSEKKESLARYRAVMSQQPELSFPLTVEEVVMMGRYPHFNFNPSRQDQLICNEVIEKMSLHDFRDRNYLTLSGGEKQRVQFARALTQIWQAPQDGSRYLFLDEPLNNLDINFQQEFLQIARTFANTNTVLIAVMHDINLAAQFGNRLFFLKAGQLVAEGTPAETLTEEVIREVFEVNVAIFQNPVSQKPMIAYK